MNNFGNWGDWSPFTEFTINGQHKNIVVKKAYFTEKDKLEPITSIIAGQWYDFHLNIDRQIEWDSLMYALVWVNDSTYTFGHLANKGGKFMAASNYVYNLSLADGTVLFEKAGENMVSSIPVKSDSPGAYLDASNHGLMVDTSKGLIKFRVRFLPVARIGQWNLSASIVYLKRFYNEHEEVSNIFRTTITILPENSEKNFHIVLFFVVLFVLFSLFAIKWKYMAGRKNAKYKSVIDISQDADFEWITNYVARHISEKIVIKDILQEWHVTKPYFYTVMNRHNQNLPDLIHKIRINKAMELLRNERHKNIEEISVEVGYTESNHFSKAFKAIEGISPREYRKKFVNT